jgi:hypothetical protein
MMNSDDKNIGNPNMMVHSAESSGTLTPIQQYNYCNAQDINNVSDECKDYKYYFPKFELKLFSENSGLITNTDQITIIPYLLDADNKEVEGLNIVPAKFTNVERPFVYELIPTEYKNTNEFDISTLRFVIENTGSEKVVNHRLDIFANDINESPINSFNNPVVEYGKKDMTKRTMKADITITAGNHRYDGSKQVKRITIIDNNNLNYSSSATRDVKFEMGESTKIEATFNDMKIGNTFRKINLHVGEDDGIGLKRIQGTFKSDNGEHYASFDKNKINKWIKNEGYVVDIGKDIKIPEGTIIDYNNITLNFSITNSELIAEENFTVYPFGKQNMNRDIKHQLLSNKITSVESFSNKLNYSTYNTLEGFESGAITIENSKELKNIHDNIIVQQSELNKNIAELKNDKNSIFIENQRRHDRTMFGGIVTTILASSLVYYMFTDM